MLTRERYYKSAHAPVPAFAGFVPLRAIRQPGVGKLVSGQLKRATRGNIDRTSPLSVCEIYTDGIAMIALARSAHFIHLFYKSAYTLLQWRLLLLAICIGLIWSGEYDSPYTNIDDIGEKVL